MIFTDDMQPYRTRKVAILNGAHTGSVLGAYLGGLDTVGEMLDDAEFSKFLKLMMLDEIVPVLDLPEEEKNPSNFGLEENDDGHHEHFIDSAEKRLKHGHFGPGDNELGDSKCHYAKENLHRNGATHQLV